MPSEFRLPDLGEGIHEGEIIEVLVAPGDAVEDGQPIMIIETDKATAEVPSPVTGIVKEIRVKPGDTVKVGEVLATFDVEGEKEEKKEQEEQKEAKEERTEKEEAKERKGPPSEPAAQPPSPAGEGPVPASPSTRRLARELGVNLREVTPSGPGGQVTADDVRSHAGKKEKEPEAPEKVEEEPTEEQAPGPAPSAGAPAPSLPDFSRWGPVEKVPLRSVRRAIAKHMALAWSQIPHVTHSDVADITELEAFRKQEKEGIEAHGGSLSLTVFALKAVVAALKEFPRFNASIDPANEAIILKNYYHIGVAVDTDRGLVVPVVRDVDRKSITQLAYELNGIVDRARNGKNDREELAGGTFTITNVGPLGGTGFTPIINYPQVAILGMAQARLQPVVRGDEKNFRIVPRLLLPLVLCFDHRVVDGADAARFINLVIGLLENRERLLMMV
jgi:pyruvate dehydrogenase E2 component (dihydrolipoamide acetyltransferase)